MVWIFSIPQTIQHHRPPRAPGPLMGASSPTFCPSKSAVPCWDKIPFECQMRRSWQVALPHSSGTFLTPQGLLTHKQCLGDCTTHLFWRGKAGGQDRAPAPWGEKCFFAVTHQCAAFGGRGSSFGEWELLCYFLFTGFSLAVFSHLGDNGFKSQSTVILWLKHFFFFPLS